MVSRKDQLAKMAKGKGRGRGRGRGKSDPCESNPESDEKDLEGESEKEGEIDKEEGEIEGQEIEDGKGNAKQKRTAAKSKPTARAPKSKASPKRAAKAKAKAKASPKKAAKAKASVKKAEKKDDKDKVAKNRNGKSKQEDENVKSKGKGTKTPVEESGEPETKKKKGAESTTWAGRWVPTHPDQLKRFDSIRTIFVDCLQPKLKSPSSFQKGFFKLCSQAFKQRGLNDDSTAEEFITVALEQVQEFLKDESVSPSSVSSAKLPCFFWFIFAFVFVMAKVSMVNKNIFPYLSLDCCCFLQSKIYKTKVPN